MNYIKTKLRYLFFGMLAILVVMLSAVSPLLGGLASAAGSESYSWGGNTATYTINGSGDAFGGGVQFTYTKPPLPTPDMLFYMSGSFQFNKNGVSCKLSQSQNQRYALTIKVSATNPNQGVINFPPIGAQSGGDPQDCTASQAKWQVVHDYFNNITINISGNPPFNAGEAASQVTVTAYPGQDVSSLPATAKFSVKQGRNHTLAESLALPSIATAEAPLHAAGKFYGVATFTLQPGDYSVCGEWNVGKGCVGITKGAGPNQVEIRDLQTQINIFAEIKMCFNGAGGNSYTLGPYEIAIESNSGTKLVTADTNSHTTNPLPADSSANTRVCHPAFIDQPNSGHGLVANLISNDPQLMHDVNLSPENYKVCIVAINRCLPYSKNVVFIIDDSDGAGGQLMSISQKAQLQKKPPTACELSFGDRRTSSFFVCPVTEIVNWAVGKFDDILNSALQPDLTIFEENGSGKMYRSAWNSFRAIALSFVVIAAIIMVAAEATGSQFVSAYTIRKVLPRLLVAAVLITISWDMLEVLYRLSDAATIGIRSLIYAPFSNMGGIQLGGGSAVTGILLGGGAIVALGWLALLSFGLSALLGVALAFFALALLKVALAGMLVASPVFIAASILPGTEKFYTFGKVAVLSLLAAPPMVSATIAISRSGAIVAYNQTNSNAAINQIIAIILYFGGYFMIIKVLQMAGGFAATIVGTVDARGKRLLSGPKNFRRKAFKKNMGNLRTGNRFEGSRIIPSGVTSGLNALSRRVANGGLMPTPGAQRRYRGRVDLISRAAAEHTAKTDTMQALKKDDDALLAMFLSGGKSARHAREELRRMHPTWSDERINRAVDTAEAVGITRQNAVAAGMLGAETKFRSLAAGQVGSDAIESTIAYMAGGDKRLAHNLEHHIRHEAMHAGRTDLAGHDMADSWLRSPLREHAKATAPAMEAHMTHIRDSILHGTMAERHRAAVYMVEAQSLLSSTTADNQRVINRELEGLGWTFDARRTQSIEDFAAQLAGLGGPGSGAGQAIRSEARIHDPYYYPIDSSDPRHPDNQAAA